MEFGFTSLRKARTLDFGKSLPASFLPARAPLQSCAQTALKAVKELTPLGRCPAAFAQEGVVFPQTTWVFSASLIGLGTHHSGE